MASSVTSTSVGHEPHVSITKNIASLEERATRSCDIPSHAVELHDVTGVAAKRPFSHTSSSSSVLRSRSLHDLESTARKGLPPLKADLPKAEQTRLNTALAAKRSEIVLASVKLAEEDVMHHAAKLQSFADSAPKSAFDKEGFKHYKESTERALVFKERQQKLRSKSMNMRTRPALGRLLDQLKQHTRSARGNDAMWYNLSEHSEDLPELDFERVALEVEEQRRHEHQQLEAAEEARKHASLVHVETTKPRCSASVPTSSIVPALSTKDLADIEPAGESPRRANPFSTATAPTKPKPAFSRKAVKFSLAPEIHMTTAETDSDDAKVEAREGAASPSRWQTARKLVGKSLTRDAFLSPPPMSLELPAVADATPLSPPALEPNSEQPAQFAASPPLESKSNPVLPQRDDRVPRPNTDSLTRPGKQAKKKVSTAARRSDSERGQGIVREAKAKKKHANLVDVDFPTEVDAWQVSRASTSSEDPANENMPGVVLECGQTDGDVPTAADRQNARVLRIPSKQLEQCGNQPCNKTDISFHLLDYKKDIANECSASMMPHDEATTLTKQNHVSLALVDASHSESVKKVHVTRNYNTKMRQAYVDMMEKAATPTATTAVHTEPQDSQIIMSEFQLPRNQVPKVDGEAGLRPSIPPSSRRMPTAPRSSVSQSQSCTAAMLNTEKEQQCTLDLLLGRQSSQSADNLTRLASTQSQPASTQRVAKPHHRSLQGSPWRERPSAKSANRSFSADVSLGVEGVGVDQSTSPTRPRKIVASYSRLSLRSAPGHTQKRFNNEMTAARNYYQSLAGAASIATRIGSET
eukprot:CAMPEP_0114264472 /NCGR_PEP_ID=MMETSP0058-20121206/23224_1 /TAXON_ID=36894 /ORGANISM="Pyramimonas parkeae, CCMP726" /LENGTH=810 /DNA_ID=CAMNT_0001381147 /DNA_START=435 /DNA_END=2867 /DNA_ORIENTATION=-